MCTIHEDSALVCDVALDHVRTLLAEAFPQSIRYTHIDYQPTLVEADPGVPAAQFRQVVEQAVAWVAAVGHP